MQYSPMGSAPATNSLLAPPVPTKKMQATELKADVTPNSGLMFVTGTIDENRKLQALGAIRALDAGA